MTSHEAQSGPLAGHRVLVVGGSSGIGLATARQSAEAGADVTIVGRQQARLDTAAQTIQAETGRAVATATLDATDVEAVAAFFDANPAWNHVVVTAGETKMDEVRSLPLKDAQASVEGKFWTAYAVARSAKFTKDGSLTLLSGVYGRKAQAGAALQGAINSALEALARGLALELQPIRVNAVAPGPIDTPLWDFMPSEAKAQMFEGIAAALPAGRVGSADDVAGVILGLMNNTFQTGATIDVDGGALLS